MKRTDFSHNQTSSNTVRVGALAVQEMIEDHLKSHDCVIPRDAKMFVCTDGGSLVKPRWFDLVWKDVRTKR